MPTTITSVAADANALFTALTADLSINLDLPELSLTTNFPIPDGTGLPVVIPLTTEDLTVATVDGTGVFDVLMKAVAAQLAPQFDKGRLVGSEYAKVYLGSMTAVMQFGTQFLLSRDRALLENMQLLETIKIAQAQAIKANAEIELARVQIQNAQLLNAELQLKAYTARNQYAGSKMDLVLGYNGILEAESKQKLTQATYEATYAQTRDSLPTGELVTGTIGTEREFKAAQGQLVSEQYELARAQTRDTLSTGGAFAGLVAVEKLMKAAQKTLVEEQVDTARAQTKDTLTSGGPVVGIASKEKALKDAQAKLVLEQTESQRGQTKDTLLGGAAVKGVLGAQTQLYLQQITSYQRDAESKGVKMLLDTWTARKTIDEGVAVPVAIDTAALEVAVTNYRSNLSI